MQLVIEATIEFRAAIPADAEVVADYHDRCFRTTYAAQLLAGEFGVPDFDGTRLQLLDWFQPESDFKTQVAVVDDRPIGHFTVLDHHLVHLFVEPEHQGIGLGRRMLGLAEQAITTAGYSELELHTRVENLDAISFYKAAGWTMTDRRIRTVEHGISYDEHVMIKHG